MKLKDILYAYKEKLNTFDSNLGKINVGVDVKDWVVFVFVVEVCT